MVQVFLGLDFHTVSEGYPDVILTVSRDEIDKTLELDGVKLFHEILLLPERIKELPDR